MGCGVLRSPLVVGCTIVTREVSGVVLKSRKCDSSIQYTDRTFAPEWSVHADFDIITTDGRVIEVATWHRKIIEAALRLVVKSDPRAGVRALRRAQNAR